MSATAVSVLDRVRTITMDAGGVFWGFVQAQAWLNEARRMYIMLKPDAGSVITNVAIIPGALQTLPAGSLAFIKAIRNVNGPAVTLADVLDIGNADPLWMDQLGLWVHHFMFDDKNPKAFWIYPNPTAPNPRLQIMCSMEPTPCDVYLDTGLVNPNPTHPLVDVDNDAALVDYVLARNYQQQNVGESQMRAATHMKNVFNLLGMTHEAATYTNPNAPQVPNVAGGPR